MRVDKKEEGCKEGDISLVGGCSEREIFLSSQVCMCVCMCVCVCMHEGVHVCVCAVCMCMHI